ncbi:mitochondrial protein Pet127-domain-containing protein [Xylariaceae sp. FL0804]|nr:mitochondrial protein Pet127-domain-containing protein [Xylariaceae sp. FL0804]
MLQLGRRNVSRAGTPYLCAWYRHATPVTCLGPATFSQYAVSQPSRALSTTLGRAMSVTEHKSKKHKNKEHMNKEHKNEEQRNKERKNEDRKNERHQISVRRMKARPNRHIRARRLTPEKSRRKGPRDSVEIGPSSPTERLVQDSGVKEHEKVVTEKAVPESQAEGQVSVIQGALSTLSGLFRGRRPAPDHSRAGASPSAEPTATELTAAEPTDKIGTQQPTKATGEALESTHASEAFVEAAGKSPKERRRGRDGKSTAKKEKLNEGQEWVPFSVSTVQAKDLNLKPIKDWTQPPVPPLSYGLERVLFNPGVYQLQDPRSHVFNFDPYLSEIMPVREFDFNALQQFVTSSKDSHLSHMAKKHGAKYTGSTSSMTSILSHFHFLLSSWRPLCPNMLSRQIPTDSLQYAQTSRAPAAVFLHWKDGTYAIDADKEYDLPNILAMLGKSMEKLLTLSKDEFEQYRHENSDQISEERRNAKEAYHYTAFQDFMMRSQLDAYDPRLPGSGMFDLKTRAVVSIRMDATGYEKGLGYEIRRRFGLWESFEREYFDMMRTAFLKYSLQVRIGRMDGIFVAFHNIQRIFGFQYIPLSEMDMSIHGTTQLSHGNDEFKISLELMNQVLNRATQRFPEKSLRLHFETRPENSGGPGTPPHMYVFAEPVEPEDIERIQSANRAYAEEYEARVLGIVKDLTEEAEEAESQPQSVPEEVLEDEADDDEPSHVHRSISLDEWIEARERVESAMNDEELGVRYVRETIEEALEESGLLRAQSSADAPRYVDSLLESLMGKAFAAPRPQGLSDRGEAKAADPGRNEAGLQPEHEEEDAMLSRLMHEPLRGGGRGEERVEKESAGDEKDESTSSKEGLSSLKNLIVQLKERFDDRETTADQIGDASSRLREFERILSNLVSQSKGIDNVDDVPQSKGIDNVDDVPQSKGDDNINEGDLLGMVLTIRNKVNDEYVTRANDVSPTDHWQVESNISDMPGPRAHTLYRVLKQRRESVFTRTRNTEMVWNNLWRGELKRRTEAGRRFREKQSKRDRKHPLIMLGQSMPLHQGKADFVGEEEGQSSVFLEEEGTRASKDGQSPQQQKRTSQAAFQDDDEDLPGRPLNPNYKGKNFDLIQKRLYLGPGPGQGQQQQQAQAQAVAVQDDAARPPNPKYKGKNFDTKYAARKNQNQNQNQKNEDTAAKQERPSYRKRPSFSFRKTVGKNRGPTKLPPQSSH